MASKLHGVDVNIEIVQRKGDQIPKEEEDFIPSQSCNGESCFLPSYQMNIRENENSLKRLRYFNLIHPLHLISIDLM